MPFIENEGVKINYEVIDEVEGDYLLLHTGLNSYKEAWTEIGYTEELKKTYKLLLIDPRGHGKSDKPIDLAKYNFNLMKDDVIILLDHLRIEKVHFFGYSLGGIIGWHLARDFPDRLHSFIAGGSRVNIEFQDNPFMRLEHMKEVEVINKELMLEPINLEYMLSELELPILTFVGDKDTSCYLCVEEYSPLIPNCTTFTLKGLNHPQTIMAYKRVLPHVLKFLKSVSET